MIISKTLCPLLFYGWLYKFFLSLGFALLQFFSIKGQLDLKQFDKIAQTEKSACARNVLSAKFL